MTKGAVHMNYTDTERTSDFLWFIDNYEILHQNYGHKFFVIQNKKILGVYDTVCSAIDETTQEHELGTFIIQECDGTEAAYTATINSYGTTTEENYKNAFSWHFNESCCKYRLRRNRFFKIER